MSKDAVFAKAAPGEAGDLWTHHTALTVTDNESPVCVANHSGAWTRRTISPFGGWDLKWARTSAAVPRW